MFTQLAGRQRIPSHSENFIGDHPEWWEAMQGRHLTRPFRAMNEREGVPEGGNHPKGGWVPEGGNHPTSLTGVHVWHDGVGFRQGRTSASVDKGGEAVLRTTRLLLCGRLGEEGLQRADYLGQQA